MFNWLMQNIATILISIALMAVTALIIARLVRQKNRASPAAGVTAPTARCAAAAIHNKLKHTEY